MLRSSSTFAWCATGRTHIGKPTVAVAAGNRKAAVDAGKAKVEGLGKLIAAHVIPSPSAAVFSLLPKL